MTTLATPASPAYPRVIGRLRIRGWKHLSTGLLLLATSVLYLWSLSASGYANSFYSAAAQAGAQSWKAWFFGSLDAGNAITVDKPPAALWLMGISVRVFGLSSWSILVPEALVGVATVLVVHLAVRRVAGHRAGLLAGAMTALTPSAALMFRFNNPDALLLLLLTLAGYVVLRATEKASGRLLLLAGALIGFGFLTKMLQAFLVLPAFALVYLIAAPTTLRRRILHLLGGLAAVVVSLGWWVAIVSLVPASSRPYVDGSTSNSILQLVFGYNGFGRLTGDETGGHGNAGFSSGVGFLRLFQGVSGGMVAWLLPAALLLLLAGVVARGRAPRTDPLRAALLLSGGAMVVTGLVFSFMAGIYHDYYTVALAPWIAMTAVLGAVALWHRRRLLLARLGLAAALAGSVAWAIVLLGQSHQQPYGALRWVVLALGIVGMAALLLRWHLRLTPIALAAGVAALLIGPAAYSLQTVGTAHTGSIVTAGPARATGFGVGFPGGAPARTGGLAAPGGFRGGFGGGFGGFPGGGPGGGFGGSRVGGGLLGGTSVDGSLTSLLTQDASSYTWSAAVDGAQNAASYELATGTSVIAIGGFNGTTPGPSLAQFETWVSEGRVHYYIASGGFGGGTGSTAGEIQQWVAQHFSATTVGGTTVYDLTQQTGTSSTGDAGTTGTNA